MVRGVAGGDVTVGIIGGEGRLEYAAVGQAVSLASRLCDQALDGQTIITEDAVALTQPNALRAELLSCAPLALK